MNAPFIQQARLTASRKHSVQVTAGETALLAEDVKEEDQRREHREAHQLLHALHPGARLRQEVHPGRLRREQEIRRAHSGGDGEEHQQDDDVAIA